MTTTQTLQTSYIPQTSQISQTSHISSTSHILPTLYTPQGKHLIIEYSGVSSEILNDDNLMNIIIDGVKKSGATVLASNVHKFTPQGISGIILLQESHASFHTYPEHNYMSLDIYTCGNHIFPSNAENYIRNRINPKSQFIVTLDRGIYSPDDRLYKSMITKGYS